MEYHLPPNHRFLFRRIDRRVANGTSLVYHFSDGTQTLELERRAIPLMSPYVDCFDLQNGPAKLKKQHQFFLLAKDYRPTGVTRFTPQQLNDVRALLPIISDEIDFMQDLCVIYAHFLVGCSPEMACPRLVVDAAEQCRCIMDKFFLKYRGDWKLMSPSIVTEENLVVKRLLFWYSKGFKDTPLQYLYYKGTNGINCTLESKHNDDWPLSSQHTTTFRNDGILGRHDCIVVGGIQAMQSFLSLLE